jgi:hypothetical protein
VRFGDPVACLLHAMLNVEEGWGAGSILPVAGVKSDDEDWFDVVRGGPCHGCFECTRMSASVESRDVDE